MKKIILFSAVWFTLVLRQVYAYYSQTALSTHNIFAYTYYNTPALTFTPTQAPTANHILISEVQIKGATASQDFIELYNPTSAQVDISGWKLRKRISTGAESSLIVIPSLTKITSRGYVLWANTLNGYSATVGADLTNSATLADNNSIALINASDTIIDQLSWGNGINQFKEGLGYPDNPGASQSLERKAGIDTDRNETDFILRSISHPQNKLSPPE